MGRRDADADVLHVRADDGVALAVHDLGGTGPPLVVSHAVGFHARAHRSLCAELGDAFHCWGVDSRGHGRSGTPPLEPSPDGTVAAMAWERVALDLLTVCDALDLVEPRGFGHSLGGAALLLAEAARPGTFAGLVCHEAAIVRPGSPAETSADDWVGAASRRRRGYGSIAEAVERLRAREPYARLAPEAFADYVAGAFAIGPDGSAVLRCTPEVEAVSMAMGYRQTTFAALERVACRVTLLTGEPGVTFYRPVDAQEYVRRLHGEWRPLDGLSHFGPLEDPVRVAAEIRRALAPAPPSGARRP